jgi:hypothetical protein
VPPQWRHKQPVTGEHAQLLGNDDATMYVIAELTAAPDRQLGSAGARRSHRPNLARPAAAGVQLGAPRPTRQSSAPRRAPHRGCPGTTPADHSGPTLSCCTAGMSTSSAALTSHRRSSDLGSGSATCRAPGTARPHHDRPTGSSTASTATWTGGWPDWPLATRPIRSWRGRTLRSRLDRPPRGAPTHRDRPLPTGTCHTMNNLGEPGAAEPHVRFDRGPLAIDNEQPD